MGTTVRTAAWSVTLTGLAVSVAGNVGHVTGHSLAVRATAAVPPLAAAAALAVGLGVLKRVVEGHHERARAATNPPASNGAGLTPGSISALTDSGAVPAGVPAVPDPGYGLNGHGAEAERVFAAEIEAGDIPNTAVSATYCTAASRAPAKYTRTWKRSPRPGAASAVSGTRYARAPKPAASTRTTPGTRPRATERKLPGLALNRQEEPPGRATD